MFKNKLTNIMGLIDTLNDKAKENDYSIQKELATKNKDDYELSL